MIRMHLLIYMLLVGFFVSTEATGQPPAPHDFTPNELGKLLVLEYHLIDYPEGRWTRTPENFRADLQMLYNNYFYPISVHDLATGKIAIPAGKTPFVLTFDDSSAGQFRYLENEDGLTIDPNCAVGILENFKKTHPDFPLTASFYVLPGIKSHLRLFAQPKYQKQKLEWLLANGYEIGSHGWCHEPLNKLDDSDVQKHLAMFVKEIRKFIPAYEVKSMALPLGARAKNKALESEGSFEGTTYKHEAVFLVGSAPALSPYDKALARLPYSAYKQGITAQDLWHS